MKRAIAMAAYLALAGCAGARTAEERPMTHERVGAPVAPSIQRITAADAGKTVTVAVGAQVAVALVGVPTAGYLWAPSQTPAFLEKTDETGGPTTQAQRQPGFAGGNHWEVFVFTVKAPGEGALKLEQRRPWETTEPPSDTLSVTIRAQ